MRRIVPAAIAALLVVPVPPAEARRAFSPLEVPARLVDTRPGLPTIDGQLAGIGLRPAGSVLEVPVAGRAGVPPDARTAALVVTVTDAQEPGHVTLFPCDASRPIASVLNYRAGGTRAATAVTRLSDEGTACVFVHGSTHLVVDVSGSFPDGDVTPLPAPARLLDTRPGQPTVDGQAAGGGALPAGTTRSLPAGGRAGLPSGEVTVLLSVTVVDPEQPGWVLAFTCGTSPGTSTLNHAAGETIANLAVVRTDASGDVCLRTSATAHLVVDAVGTVAPDAVQVLAPSTRLVDTRVGGATVDGQRAGLGERPPGGTLAVPVAGRGGVPEGAGAALLNVVAVDARAPGHITLHPGGTVRPLASHLNHAPGDTVANAAFTRLGADGEVCLFTSGVTHVVVDVVAWLPGVAPTSGAGCPHPPVFPTRRIVALYGNDTAAALGALGEQPPAEAAARLAAVAAPYAAGDRPVQGAFELIATIATSFPGAGGLYRSPSDAAHIQRYLDVAVANDLLLILDIQPGRSDFLTELQRYDRFLRHPSVHAALDPEWHVGPGQVPGEVVGQVSAAEVNQVADYLAAIVDQEDLPEKLLVVHQFQDRMVTDREQLREPAGVALTIHMDGFGTQAQKLATYAVVQAAPPLSNGFKLFYDEDIDRFTPGEVLRLSPVPDLVTYQ